jgi:GNAT superfamily N-acetyltransferase
MIRRAAPQDAETLAALGRETFSDTFAHLYPPEDLGAFLAESYSTTAFRRALADPRQAIWLAEAEGRAIGYAHAGPCALPHPEVTPGCGELKRLYVRREVQGRGVGDALMRTALDWLEAPGRKLWIGVWSLNHGAQRFYGRHGFSKVGEYKFPVGRSRDHEFILRRG